MNPSMQAQPDVDGALNNRRIPQNKVVGGRDLGLQNPGRVRAWRGQIVWGVAGQNGVGVGRTLGSLRSRRCNRFFFFGSGESLRDLMAQSVWVPIPSCFVDVILVTQHL